MFEAHFNPKKREIVTFTSFATKACMLPVKSASSDSYLPPPMGAVGDTFEDRAQHLPPLLSGGQTQTLSLDLEVLEVLEE